ncbi:hypothetical protein [Bradyrhizobium vignae]|uniref:hypothetical protein n=1 Tax=Bradyrhizobium vignae TaxID=1549949 RepID=UPI00100B71EB|nr:hypothetical protein [Bradyrhizobium vignae]RXG86202.1 hypothetical protein EAV90_34005 [Bradyrhizobium vignae]
MVEAETAIGSVTVGIVGTVGATLPVTSGTAGVGKSAAELTPRLVISVEPRGTPVRGVPPGVVGDVEVGLEDALMLFEPEPHMPDMPAVSRMPDAVDIPELCVMPDVADIPVVAGIDADMSTDAAVLPAAAPVAGVESAIVIPPPS